MGPGPQWMYMVSFSSKGQISLRISLVTQPVLPFQFSLPLSRMQWILTRSETASSSFLSTMSSSVLLAKSRIISMFSSFMLTISMIVWQTGVIPLPPAIKKIFLDGIFYPSTMTVPLGSYPNRPNGPSTLIVSPTFSVSRQGVSLPPFGKLGLLSGRQIFIKRSMDSFCEHGEMGVYFLMTVYPSGHSIVLMFSMIRKCCPICSSNAYPANLTLQTQQS